MNYETFGNLSPQEPSAGALLSQIAFREEQNKILERPDIEGIVETIFNVCAGLQLSLCMAGRTFRTKKSRMSDIRKVFEVYASHSDKSEGHTN